MTKGNKLKGSLMINKTIKSFLRFNYDFLQFIGFFFFLISITNKFQLNQFSPMILKIVALGTYFNTKLCIYVQTLFIYFFLLF